MTDSFNLGESSDIVAHYTSLEAICQHILPSGQMRFSPLIATNDPYEFKKRLSHVRFNDGTGSYDAYDKETYEKLDSEYSEIILNNVKVLCVTGSFCNRQANNLKCYLHPRMWAQYADNHDGAALIFDRSVLECQIEKYVPNVVMGDIEYVRNFSLNEENYVEITQPLDFKSSIYNHIEKYVGTILFNKHADWASEDERRFVWINSEKPGYEFVNYGDALKAIVLGINAKSAEYLPVIRNIVPELPVYQCAWATRGEYFVYRHHRDSIGGLVVENFEDGQAGTELVLRSWPSDNEQ